MKLLDPWDNIKFSNVCVTAAREEKQAEKMLTTKNKKEIKV